LKKNYGDFQNPNVVSSMDITSNPQTSVSPARTRLLRFLNKKGKAYQRWADVEAELERVLPLHHSVWIAEAPDLHCETLTCIIRQMGKGNPEVFRCLLQEVLKQALWMARPIYGFDEVTEEFILEQIEIEIVKRILTDTPTRRSDYLEMAFARAVRRIALDIIRKAKKSPEGNRGDIVPYLDDQDHDFDKIERPIELAPETGPSPETQALVAVMFEQACDAVVDPKDLEAAVLHYCEGWPVASLDKKKETIARLFNETERKVWVRLERAMAAMRKALGVDLNNGSN
jgi:DNA-directed RNA polymerase specialized sigma24 family protein